MKARIRLSGGLLTAVQVVVLLVVAGTLFAVTAYFSMQKAIFGRDVRVPRILEMEMEPARDALAPLELRLESVASRHDDLVPAGQILSQDPPPDAKFKRGRKVKVYVSLGPEQHVVPDVAGMPVPRASVLLRQDKLRLGQVAYAYTESNQENLVMAQDPPPGASIEEDGQVDFLVSRGMPRKAWVMPDLVGRSLEQAQRFLARQGFRVGNVRHVSDGAVPPGRVQRQYPLAGYPVHRDDLISLVVAGPEEETR
jgi:serine/threonine-protein kinase